MTQLNEAAAARVMQRLDPAYKPPGSEAGTPAARFVLLMAGLEMRLPDPDPLSAQPPERRYLAQIDEALRLLEGMRCHLTGQGRYMERQELIDGIEKLIGPWKPMCDCGAKRRPECPGHWEPGCDLGANETNVRAAPASAVAVIDSALGFRYIKTSNSKAPRGFPYRITQAQYDLLTPLGRTMYEKIKP